MLICVKCQVAMKVEKIGVPAISMAGPCFSDVYSGDLLQCPECGHQVILPARSAYMPHFHADHTEHVAAIKGTAVSFWHTLKEKENAHAVV